MCTRVLWNSNDLAVLTGREIPLNSFGPSLQDQPVLADAQVANAGH